jgi:hypothetical protein
MKVRINNINVSASDLQEQQQQKKEDEHKC